MSTRRSPLQARNPLVAPALMRLAGSHRRSGKSRRQRERSALRRELTQIARDPSPGPASP